MPPNLNHLRGNKNVKSVEELEADIKQMVGICQENYTEGSRNDSLLSSIPHNPDRLHSEQCLEISSSKDNEKGEEQGEDMSAFKKFVSTEILYCILIL